MTVCVCMFMCVCVCARTCGISNMLMNSAVYCLFKMNMYCLPFMASLISHAVTNTASCNIWQHVYSYFYEWVDRHLNSSWPDWLWLPSHHAVTTSDVTMEHSHVFVHVTYLL